MTCVTSTYTNKIIYITVPPTFVSHPQEILDAEEWTEVTLNCSASGSPTPLIMWEREGGTQLPVGADVSPPSMNGNTVRKIFLSKWIAMYLFISG